MEMINFVIINEKNEPVRFGVCDSNNLILIALSPGETLHQSSGDIPLSNQPVVYSYLYPRTMAYPPIGEQLSAIWDMLAKDLDSMPSETLKVYQKILQVKTDIPKGKKYVENVSGTGPAFNILE